MSPMEQTPTSFQIEIMYEFKSDMWYTKDQGKFLDVITGGD